MNKETKLILETLRILLVKSQSNFSRNDPNKEREILEEIDQVLNPKEVVPYEDSLEDGSEICATCGYSEDWHRMDEDTMTAREIEAVCQKFVKSSKGEGK